MVRTLGALVVLLALAACSNDDAVGREELHAVKVASGFDFVGEGVEEASNGFVFRLYIGPRESLGKRVVTPPRDGYEPFRLVSHFHEGWTPLAGWRGPSADRKKECLIAAEIAEGVDHLPDELSAAQEQKVRSGDEALLRISADCSEAAHSFD